MKTRYLRLGSTGCRIRRDAAAQNRRFWSLCAWRYVPESSIPIIPSPTLFSSKAKSIGINWVSPSPPMPGNTRSAPFTSRMIWATSPGPLQDYQQRSRLNSLAKGTCQLVTSATLVNGVLPSTLNPAPCMFTLRLRLAYLLRASDPATAISLYQEVLQIDPLRPDANALMGEAYIIQAGQAQDADDQAAAYQNAIDSFQAELALNPVTPNYTALTADQANNAHVHWALADVYEKLGRNADAASELKLYLLATQWHSDVYPWRIALAKAKLAALDSQQYQ